MAKTGEQYIGSFDQTAFDEIAATAIGLTALAPLAVTAAALAWEQRDHRIFFKQSRIGLCGDQFEAFKLKTISGQDRADETEAGGSEHPMASKLGQFARKTGVDETPQCINVFRRELHVMGIRPQVPRTLEQRRLADPALFDYWYYWAKLNPEEYWAQGNNSPIYITSLT